MRITKLVFIEVSELQEQYRRPYKLRVDGSVMDALDEAFSRDSVASARPKLLLDAITRGLSFSTNVEDTRIAGNGRRGGWDGKRFRFLMEITVEEPGRRGQPGSRVIVSGYTDNNSYSSASSIDEETKMYINSVIGVRDTWRTDRRGDSYLESKIVKPYQVLSGVYGRNSNNDYLCRPQDIFRRIQTIRDVGDDGMDTRVMFKAGVEPSERVNNTRAGFLSRIVSNDFHGRMEVVAHGGDNFQTSRNVKSADEARDIKMSRNPFIDTLMSANGNVKESGYFIYKDLVPFSESGTMRSLDADTSIAPLQNNDFDYESIRWDGANGETNAAVTLTREVPSIMTDQNLASMRFTINNDHLDDDGNPEFDLIEWTSHFEGLDGPDVADVAIRRIIEEVYLPLTRFNKLHMDIEVTVDIGGMTAIEMIWDGGSNESFNFPTFADGIVPPTMTRNRSVLDDLAKSYTKLRKECIDPLMNDEVDLLDRENNTDRDEREDRDRSPIINLFGK